MQLIPITRAYREGWEGIRWDVDDLGVVKAVPDHVEFPPITRFIPVEWAGRIPGMPASRYQGC
jgi:hypothetical protein